MTPGQKVKGWSMGGWITINFKEWEQFPIGIIEFDEHELTLQVIQGLSLSTVSLIQLRIVKLPLKSGNHLNYIFTKNLILQRI